MISGNDNRNKSGNPSERREGRLKNKRVLKKASWFLAFLMILSVLTPVLAFAAVGFKDVKYKGNQVRGTVYVTTDEDISKPIVNVYDPDGNKIATAKLKKPKSVGDYVYYRFKAKVGKYDYVTLREGVTNSVYETVYRSPVKDKDRDDCKDKDEHKDKDKDRDKDKDNDKDNDKDKHKHDRD